MVQAKIQSLRDEIKRLKKEIEEFQSNYFKLARAMTEENSQLRSKITTLKSQIAKITKRSALYESEHTASSMNSIYHSERDNFRKKHI